MVNIFHEEYVDAIIKEYQEELEKKERQSKAKEEIMQRLESYNFDFESFMRMDIEDLPGLSDDDM